MRNILWSLWVTLILAACGGGSSTSPATTTPQAPASGGVSSESSAATSQSISSQSSASSTAGVSSSSASSVAVDDNPCAAGRRIVGYFPSWQGDVVDIQYQYLTHVNYSFVLPKPSGALEPISQANENELMQLVTLAHGQAVKVGIAVGGWNDGDDSAFVTLAADAEKRALFVKAMVEFVERYQLDGVDMDWEYPSTATQAKHYVQLMQELRAALDALPREQFLSAAVVAQGDWNGQYIREAVFNEIDFLNIMAYDEYGAVSHSSMDYARTSLEYWAKRGLPRAKTVLGLPFYARPSWLSYQHYVSVDADNACADSVADSYYNGLPTMRAKAQLAQTDACGVMAWELSQDTSDQTSLLKALWEIREGVAPSYWCPD